VKGVCAALTDSPAVKIFVSNIMTELGETDDFTARDHLETIMQYAGDAIIDYVVVNTGSIDAHRLKRYREEQAVPVTSCFEQIQAMGIKVLGQDLVADKELAWHDSDKLARVIMDIIQEHAKGN
jgi:uncharacterized cofD-like protein